MGNDIKQASQTALLVIDTPLGLISTEMEGSFVYEAAVFSLWDKGKAVMVGIALLSDDPGHIFEAYKLFWSLSDRKFKNIAMDEEET